MRDSILSGMDSFEVVKYHNIYRDIRTFFSYSNEKSVLTKRLVRIVHPTGGDTVLDVGCDEGYFIRAIYPKVRLCVGIDPDGVGLESLRSKTRNARNIELVQTRFEDYKTNRKFTIVLSSHTFSFFRRKEALLSKMLNLLQPQGRIVLVLHSETSPQLQLLNEFHEKVLGTQIRHISAQKLVAVMEELGMHPRMTLVRTECRIPDLETACKLSTFLLRVDYSGANKRLRLKIRQFFSRIRDGRAIVVKTVHGVIVASK